MAEAGLEGLKEESVTRPSIKKFQSGQKTKEERNGTPPESRERMSKAIFHIEPDLVPVVVTDSGAGAAYVKTRRWTGRLDCTFGRRRDCDQYAAPPLAQSAHRRHRTSGLATDVRPARPEQAAGELVATAFERNPTVGKEGAATVGGELIGQ